MMSEKIRVMQITHDLDIGGLQRVVVDLAVNLNKDRFDVSVCVLRDGNALEGELLDNGIKVFRLAPADPHKANYFLFWRLVRIFKRERPHIIHTHNTQPFTDGVTAAIIAGVPVRIHTDHGREFPDKRRYMFAEWLLSHFTSQVVAVSEGLKEDLSKYEQIPSRKIKVILNGVAPEQGGSIEDKCRKKAELGIDHRDRMILGYVGRLSPEKGVTHLLQAMRRLADDFPDVLLLIIGEGELRYELMCETQELALEKNIRFLGPRTDVSELMQILDIFILPSLREGLPLVLLEAAAASLPIVASDVGGIKHIVKESQNGFLVKPQDADSLYKAIKKLIRSDTLRKQYSSKALHLFKDNFTLDKMITEYETTYEEFH